MLRWRGQGAVRNKATATATALRGWVDVTASNAVSLWSRTTIWIGADRVCVLGSNVQTDVPDAITVSGEVPDVLKAVEALAPQPVRRGLHTVRVVVGAPYVRYFVLPWRPLPRPVDWTSLARMQFAQTGGGVEGWRFAIPDGPWGHSRLAAAIPEALSVGLEQICKQRKLKLTAIEPSYTFALLDHARRIVDAKDGIIAVVELEEIETESAIASIGLRSAGQWSGFIALPVAGTLDDVLRDALVLCGAPHPERLYVIGDSNAQRWVADTSRVEWLAAPWSAAP